VFTVKDKELEGPDSTENGGSRKRGFVEIASILLRQFTRRQRAKALARFRAILHQGKTWSETKVLPKVQDCLNGVLASSDFEMVEKLANATLALDYVHDPVFERFVFKWFTIYVVYTLIILCK
jgi:hypothetical protein